MLRTGPYELTLADLEAAPHGIDLGPLEPRLPEVLRTATGGRARPRPIADDVRACAPRSGAAARRVVLVGRRQLRSNNSWMHNLDCSCRAGSGARCTSTPTTRRGSASSTASPRDG